jgi:phytol kinase
VNELFLNERFVRGFPASLTTQFLVVGGWLGLVATAAAIAHCRFQANSEVIRKIVHIGTGNVIVLAWLLHVPNWLGIGASVLFSIITLLSYRFPILPFIDSVGRKSFGTFFYSLSFGLLISYFWPKNLEFYAALGILSMAWGDGLAAIVGKRWGRHPYTILGMKKSWEGSLTMFLMTFIVAVAILGSVLGLSGWIMVMAGAIALGATTLEAFSKFGIDNLTVPLGSAAIAYGLSSLIFG